MKKVFLVIFILFFLIVVIALFPVKFAVKQESIKGKEYVIAQICYNSASNWEIIGDGDGRYDFSLPALLKGDNPLTMINHSLISSTFICYGEYQGEITTPAGYKNIVFYVKDWDILYPIERLEAGDILPKSWICLLDIF